MVDRKILTSEKIWTCEECNQELDYDTVSGICDDCQAEFDRQDREADKDREHDEKVALGYV